MAVEVTSDELKAVLQDEEVQALIVKKLSEKKTEGLAEAVTAQYKSLGIVADEPEPASTTDAAADTNTADSAASSADAAA
ncbi:hypothetical protein N5580_13140 [Pantoea piersonii]|uniref:Uncharacterized protein n=1 Tax=Pantoea piersonii TaxID=2364647 RepID=A0AAJ5QH36_9GAMM|nr:hypothetical protein [Pantoea piersonii]WBG90031.1 hypothetical protein N5580_13140 [Pantoea piersonii]